MKRCSAWRGRRSQAFVLAIFCTISLACRAQQPAASDTPTTAKPELDLQAYERELTRVGEAVKNPATINDLRRSLPDSWTVKNGDRVFSVSTKEISEALRTIELDPTKTATAVELEVRLNMMRQQAEQLSVLPAGANATEAESKLKKILERGEFQEATGPSAWDLMRARINRWILIHIIKVLQLLHISQKTGNAIAWTVVFAAVVLLFYVVYRWLSKSTKDGNFRAEVEPSASDARHWLQEAQAAADRGNFRDAIHCAYWAAVAHLEDVRLLSRDRARTPRESLRQLERHPKEQGLLQGITRTFEFIWYGYRPVSATEWEGTKQQLERMGCLRASTAPTVPS